MINVDFSCRTGGLYSGCMCAMLRLNHLLVEPWLPLLWAVMPFLQPHSASPGNCAWMEMCMEVYSKLRQVSEPFILTF